MSIERHMQLDAMPGEVIKQAAAEIGLPSTAIMLHRNGK